MKPNYSTYEAMDKHANFYQNQVSKKIIFKKTIKGRPVKIACHTTSINEAKAFVEDKLAEMFSTNPAEALRRKKGILNLTIEDGWKDLMLEREPRSSPATIESYQGSWKIGIAPFWGNLSVADVTSANVSLYENWYLKNHPTRVFANTRKHLVMLFNFLEKTGRIVKAPRVEKLDEIIATTVRREKVGRVYTDKEVKALIDCAVNDHTKLAILIFRYMGARKMEVLSSKWEQVDFKKKTMKLWSFKNKKWREVPIPVNVISHLKSVHQKSLGDEFMFPAQHTGSFISGQVFDDFWKITKDRAEIVDRNVKNGARIHDLRHTFATQTARDNWPPLIACKVLDMSLKEYQRTYTHFSEKDVSLLMKRSFGVTS